MTLSSNYLELAPESDVDRNGIILDTRSDYDTPLGTKLTNTILSIVAKHLTQDSGCHSLDHTHRVHHTALLIGSKLGADSKIISAASLLHDIARSIESKAVGKICHAMEGSIMAQSILRDLNFSNHEIKKICHCIASHRFRGKQKPESLEAKILFDADKLDSIGAIGIGRAFLFAGQVGARLHNPNNDISNSKSYSKEDTAYREFKVKLCKVKNRMLTGPGRKMAVSRHQFMEEFFEQLKYETGN
jgi:uncharacterized protein